MTQWLYAISNEVGISGVILILIAYYLVSIGRIFAKSFTYQILNFAGAWLILFSLFFHWNLSSVLIEIAWILISLMGLVQILKTRLKKFNNKVYSRG